MEELSKYYKKIKDHEIAEFAAQSAFFTILSIIPFTIIFISLIKYINIDKSTLLFYAKEIIPDSFDDFSIGIIEEIYSKTFTTISISIAFTLWSASKGFTALMRGFHKIYELDPKNKIYFKFRSLIFTVFMLLMFTITFLFLVWGSQIQTFFNSVCDGTNFQKVVNFIIRIRRYGISLIIFMYFMLVYKFVPQCKLKFKNQVLRSMFCNCVLVCYIIWIISIFKAFFRIFNDVSEV